MTWAYWVMLGFAVLFIIGVFVGNAMDSPDDWDDE